MRFLVGIDRGTFDLAIGSFRHLPDRFMTCHLLSDEHVCVMRAGHPEAQVSLSLEKYLAADHLLLSMSSSRSDEVDEALASRDLARRIVMRVPACARSSHSSAQIGHAGFSDPGSSAHFRRNCPAGACRATIFSSRYRISAGLE